MKKVLVVVALFFGSVIALAVATEPDARPAPASSTTVGGYSHELLQRDADMTQRMSLPTADGAMQRGQVPDAQLDHSRSASFVRALEQHQADIDRMLARPSP